MSKILLIALLAFPIIASADFIARCDPPNSKTADRAAKITAGAVRSHLLNIEQLREGVPNVLPMFNVEDSISIIAGHSRMCFQFFKAAASNACDYSIAPRATPFPAPAVCVWSKLSAGSKTKVRALGVSPE